MPNDFYSIFGQHCFAEGENDKQKGREADVFKID